MINSKPDSDRATEISGSSEPVQGDPKPKVLFNRPTKQIPPHEVLRYGITDSALNGEVALFDVLPGIGKSRSIPKVACGTGMPFTILTNLSENYDQYRRWGKEDGITIQKLPVAPDLCPTLRGEYPKDEDSEEAREAYDAGWPAGAVHRGFDVPCDRGRSTCPYRETIAEIDPDGQDPLVGHFTQAYNPAYVEDRVVVIDEDCFSAYVQQFNNPIEKAEEYIATLDYFPFDGVPYGPSDAELKEAIEILENEGLETADHRDTVGEFHAKAPLVAYALLTADRMENDWFVADLPGERTASFHKRPSKGSLHLLDPPDFSRAEAIIVLDATPCIADWTRLLGGDLKHHRLFGDDQRNQYLREQGYEFVQLNNRVWPVSGGGVSIPRCEAYLREVYRKHGQRPDLVSSKKVIKGGENWRGEKIEGLEDRELDHLWRNHLHYGDLRGKNDLEESELLVVLGSPGRRDTDIQYRAAFHGECAEPATDSEGERLSGYDLDYQSDAANEYLESVRRGGVFQAVMRAGRTQDTEATVYIATGMVPDWLETKKAGRGISNISFDACTNLRSEGERQVIEALRGAEEMKPSELYEQVDISQDRAKKLRQVLQERGLVEKQGECRWTIYRDSGLEDINIAGSVDLSLSVCSPFNNSLRGGKPIESQPEPVVSRREPPADPSVRYPGWMREVQRRLEGRKLDEQIRQFQRGQR